jgi:hypothetical protein
MTLILSIVAAEVLRTNRPQFVTNVNRSMKGQAVNGVAFDNVLQ